MSFVVSLLLKSQRQSAIFEWTFAALSLAFALFFDPLTFLDKILCLFASLFSCFLLYLGAPDLKPSDVTQISLMPTSIPVFF